MSRIEVYSDDDPSRPRLESDDASVIRTVLQSIGVRFERWVAAAPIQAGDPPERIAEAYGDDIARWVAERPGRTFDVISMAPDHPNKRELRATFLREHAHTDDEVRIFVDGGGHFSLHVDRSVYEVLCTRGDLIAIPAHVLHWFDMGEEPRFVAIRFFEDATGWIAHYTRSGIAERFVRSVRGAASHAP